MSVVHATFTFQRHYPTTEEIMGIENGNTMSLSELLERAGLEHVGQPLDKGNITGVSIDREWVEIYMAWEVKEEIGECEYG